MLVSRAVDIAAAKCVQTRERKGETMTTIDKVVRLGTVDLDRARRDDVFCRIEFRAGRLSISGVEGPLKNGSARGGCGQINMGLRPRDVQPAPGWTLARIDRFLFIWDRWHLNDVTAGSPAQMAWLRVAPVRAGYGLGQSHYDRACASLVAVGLHPDPNYLVEGRPYHYGEAWLSVEVPAAVVEYLAALPDTDKKPAWV